MRFGTWILQLVEPLIARIFVSLGVSMVSIVGLVEITDTLKSQAVTGLGLLSPEMLDLFLLAGGAQGLGIITGACTTKLILWRLQSSTKILSANPG